MKKESEHVHELKDEENFIPPRRVRRRPNPDEAA
jgi:hypothetical protein